MDHVARGSFDPGDEHGSLLGPAVRETGIPNLGLRAAEENGVGSLGVFGGLLGNAPTLGAALERAVRHHPTITSNRPLSLRPRGDRIEFSMKVAARFDPRDIGWQQDDHYSLGLMLSLVRMAAGPHWRPAEVHLQTDEAAGLRDAGSLADTRVMFRQPVTMVAVPRELLATPLLSIRAGQLSENAIDDWQSSAPVHDFAGSVRQAIETLPCGDDYPTVAQTAAFVGMSVRTLQRHLAAHRTSHDLLVAQTRLATAATVLQQTDAKILDLALDLGYSDHANFTRAFRRWTGCSPRQYRVRFGVKSLPAAILPGEKIARSRARACGS